MTEYMTQTELDYIAWRAENPETFCAIVIVALLIVAAIYVVWWVGERRRRIYTANVARQRQRTRYEIRAHGGL